MNERRLPEETRITSINYLLGKETYIFRFPRGSERELAVTMGKWAEDPRLSFTFFDARSILKILKEEYKTNS